MVLSTRKWALMLSRTLEQLDKGISYAWWLFIALGVFTTWEVVMRYFFDNPHSWFEEVSVCMSITAVFLGCGVATWKKRQIALDFIITRLNQKWQRIAGIIVSLVTIAISVTLVVGLLKYGFFLDHVGATYMSTLQTPYSIGAYAIAVGMFLNAIFSLGNLFGAAQSQKAEEIATKGG